MTTIRRHIRDGAPPTNSDYQGLTPSESASVQSRQMAHQDEQPGPHARWGLALALSLSLSLTAVVAGWNGSDILKFFGG